MKSHKFLYWNSLSMVIFLSLFLNACASKGPEFQVNVDSLNSGEIIPGKSFIILPGNKDTAPSDLQFKEYATYINYALISKGYTPAENFESADISIFLSYGLGDPKEHQFSYSLPVYGQTGVSSATTYGTFNTYGNTYGNTNRNIGSYSSTTTFTPAYGITGYRSYSGAITHYFRFLLLEAYDLKAYRDEEKEVQIWKTTVTSSGSSQDLRRIFPVMVAASKPYIGVNSGQQVEVILHETDQAVIDIKGINATQERKSE